MTSQSEREKLLKKVKQNELKMAAIRELPLYKRLMETELVIDHYPYNPNYPFSGLRRFSVTFSKNYFIIMRAKLEKYDLDYHHILQGKDIVFQVYSMGVNGGYSFNNISFEEVFDHAPLDAQEKMIWNLDLFR